MIRPGLQKELRAIANWMEVLPDHKVIGGMVLSWGEASKALVEAATVLDEVESQEDSSGYY